MSTFGQLVKLDSILPINVGLTSPAESTMVSLLGRPIDVTETKCDNNKISTLVRKLRITANVGPFKVTGIKPAVSSLQAIFKEAQDKEPELWGSLTSAGMLCCRLRKPTSGRKSTQLSNHSWGTALDVAVDGEADGGRDRKVQLAIAILIPIFNKFGWFSGAGFTTAED